MENDKNVALLGTAATGDSGNKSTPQVCAFPGCGKPGVQWGKCWTHAEDGTEIDDGGTDALSADVLWAIVRDLAACDPISNDCSAWCQLCVKLNSESVYEPEDVVHTPECPWARAKALTTR
jgi:hypothetical protein